jgi:hypothetical protein
VSNFLSFVTRQSLSERDCLLLVVCDPASVGDLRKWPPRGLVLRIADWLIRVLELQAYLATLIPKFEFAMTPEAFQLRREAAVVMVPAIEGAREKGAWLPLRVSPIQAV